MVENWMLFLCSMLKSWKRPDPTGRMASGIVTLVALIVCLAGPTLTASKPAPKAACKISEFSCENGRCVPLNRYCNNVNECGDSTDEPRYCTRKYRRLQCWFPISGGCAGIIL
ncbi:Low-density lipoprotein receptor domain class A [Popillia japonica]|uniref:Low-density lipoprotein receptor domain class A n=1 Tax=Popillia japonica TaxID=7064 RepID=A0AAW1N4L5_POPJA